MRLKNGLAADVLLGCPVQDAPGFPPPLREGLHRDAGIAQSQSVELIGRGEGGAEKVEGRAGQGSLGKKLSNFGNW